MQMKRHHGILALCARLRGAEPTSGPVSGCAPRAHGAVGPGRSEVTPLTDPRASQQSVGAASAFLGRRSHGGSEGPAGIPDPRDPRKLARRGSGHFPRRGRTPLDRSGGQARIQGEAAFPGISAWRRPKIPEATCSFQMPDSQGPFSPCPFPMHIWSRGGMGNTAEPPSLPIPPTSWLSWKSSTEHACAARFRVCCRLRAIAREAS